MKKHIIPGLIFAFSGLLCLVLRSSDVNNINIIILGIAGVYLIFKIKQRQSKVISVRSSNIAIIITIIGIGLFAFNNTYAYSVLGFALISDLIFPLIFKKK